MQSINFIYSNVEYNGNWHKDVLMNVLSFKDTGESFKLNFINENDVTDINQRYCLIYPLQGHFSLTLERKEELLSDVILDKIKKGFDITVFLCTEAECEFEHCFDLINEWTTKIGIPNDIIYSVSGNSKLENIETYGIKSIKTFNPIINRVCGTLLANTMNNEDELWLEDKKYLFQCYNNMPKEHRLIILSLLKKENLLDSIDWSLMRPYDRYKLNELGMFSLDCILEREIILDIQDFYKLILNNGETTYSEYEDESMRNPLAGGEPNLDITFSRNPYKNSYINIVNESQFELKNTIHITEKSLTPFGFYQLPIFVATQGHVQKLKDLYGFDMFDDIINHEYDSIENPQERMLVIIDEIKRLNSNRSGVIDFYKNNKDRFYKNRKILEKLNNIDPYRVVLDEFLK